jgi:autotransporter-associated beta strand protein
MKKALLALSLVVCSSNHASAQLYWDRDDGNPGASTGTTASGTWDLAATNWSANSGGTGANVAWTAGSAAVFSADTDATGTSTVTPTGTMSASSITIEEGTIIIGPTGAVNTGAGAINVGPGATLETNSSLRIVTTAGSVYNLNNATLRTTNPGAAGSFIDIDSDISLTGANVLSHVTANILNIIQATTDISGGGSFAKEGDGVLAIASAATHTGGTIVNDGELRIRTTANRLPIAGAVTVNSSGTNNGILNLNGVNQQIGSLSGNGRVGLANALLTIDGGTSTTFTGTIEDTANAGAGGSVAVGGRLTKAGTSILTLTGANIYTGVTNINGGTLLANNSTGSATGANAVTVGAAGTLGGTGSVSGSVTVSGTLAPGASIESLGSGALTFNTGSIYSYEINGSAPLASAADLMDSTGSLTINTGVTLSLSGGGSFPGGTKLTMISYNGTWNGGTFTGYADDSFLAFGGQQYIINYNDVTPGGNFLADTAGALGFVTLTAVPELSSVLGFGLTGLCSAAAVWFGKRRGISLSL